MAFSGGFATGFQDAPVVVEPPPGGGGGRYLPLLPRWRRYEPLPPPPPPKPVRITVRIRVAAPRLLFRVLAVTFPPPSMRVDVRSAATLVGPPALAYAWKAQLDAREAREIAEALLALEVMGW